MGSEAERCDICGAVLHWSPLVEGLPKMSTVSDCRHVVKLDEPTAEQKVKAKWPDAIEFYHHFGLCEILSGQQVLGSWWGGAGCMPKAWAEAASRLSEGEHGD